MAKVRRGSLRSRLASLERDADRARDDDCQQVTLYLPRKDGDTQPCGVISENRWVRTILYDATVPDPERPKP